MASTLVRTMIFCVAFVAMTSAQPGIGKNTVAVSERSVQGSYLWKMTYLPVVDADDSCFNNVCTCGACARVALKTSTSANTSTRSLLQANSGFGLHGVLAAGYMGSRSAASGSLSVAEIEDIFDEQLGNMSTYSPWMDYRVGLYVSSLDSYITAFKAGGIAYLSLTWQDNGVQYYSLVVHAPKTQEIFELISKAEPAPGSKEFLTTGTRHVFNGQAHLELESDLAWPLHVSRTARDLGVVKTFYKSMFGLEPSAEGTWDNGVKYLFFQTSEDEIQVQYWQRDGQSGKHTTTWFEEYLEEVNKHYMTSSNSCWPVWGDNHFGIPTFQGVDVNAVVSKYNAANMSYGYHAFSNPGSTIGGGYFALPGGWAVQLDDISWNGCGTEGFSTQYCYTSCYGASPVNATRDREDYVRQLAYGEI